MEEIKEDLELMKFNSVDATTVYMGSFSDLTKADLIWRKADEKTCKALCLDAEILKLSEIVEQLKDKTHMITIFIEEPLSGRILQYGNYGDSWWEIGTTCGYA